MHVYRNIFTMDFLDKPRGRDLDNAEICCDIFTNHIGN